jgi:hypothetical protein
MPIAYCHWTRASQEFEREKQRRRNSGNGPSDASIEPTDGVGCPAKKPSAKVRHAGLKVDEIS